MKAHGICRIGRDAEVKTTAGGDVASFPLAFAYGKKGSDGKRPTQWVEVSLWGQRAASLAPHLTKGKQLVAYLEDVHVQTYSKQDGTQTTKMVARVTDVEFVSGEKQESKPVSKPPEPKKEWSQGSGFDDMESDVPF